jgi:hypothetical protein
MRAEHAEATDITVNGRSDHHVEYCSGHGEGQDNECCRSPDGLEARETTTRAALVVMDYRR